MMMIALESNSNNNKNMGMVMVEPRRGGSFEASSMEVVDHVNVCSCSSNSSSAAASSTTSSIGKDSDISSDGNGDEENGEVQSAFSGNIETSTMDCMNSLEEALPMRRGISKFYNGKSKSYTSLREATSSSNIKEIAKPENAYSRRRRNLLAFNHRYGISKKPIPSSKSTLALAVAMSSSESIGSISEDSSSSSVSKSPPRLPPLHPRSRTYSNNDNLPSPRHCFSPWNSFSVADLQQCAVISDKADH